MELWFLTSTGARKQGTIEWAEYPCTEVALEKIKRGCYDEPAKSLVSRIHWRKRQYIQCVTCDHNLGLRCRVVASSWHHSKVGQGHWVPANPRIQARAHHPQSWAGGERSKWHSGQPLHCLPEDIVPWGTGVKCCHQGRLGRETAGGTRNKEALGESKLFHLWVPLHSKGASDTTYQGSRPCDLVLSGKYAYSSGP